MQAKVGYKQSTCHVLAQGAITCTCNCNELSQGQKREKLPVDRHLARLCGVNVVASVEGEGLLTSGGEIEGGNNDLGRLGLGLAASGRGGILLRNEKRTRMAA